MIATAVTVPVVVVVGLLLGNLTGSGTHSADGSSSSGPQPAITVAAPPPDPAAQAPCTKVLAGLPVQLDGLNPRGVVSNPSSPFVVGWGNPTVVLRCGVAKPADVHAGSNVQFFGINGVFFDQTAAKGAVLFTSVDRAVYIEVSVPTKYASGPMPALATVIAKALPAVCQVGATVPTSDQCAERK